MRKIDCLDARRKAGSRNSDQIRRNVKRGSSLHPKKCGWTDGWTDGGLSIRQREREMRVGKLKWMRQALKRIGHGAAVGQGRFVSRLRSQSGSNNGWISVCTRWHPAPSVSLCVALTAEPSQITLDLTRLHTKKRNSGFDGAFLKLNETAVCLVSRFGFATCRATFESICLKL